MDDPTTMVPMMGLSVLPEDEEGTWRWYTNQGDDVGRVRPPPKPNDEWYNQGDEQARPPPKPHDLERHLLSWSWYHSTAHDEHHHVLPSPSSPTYDGMISTTAYDGEPNDERRPSWWYDKGQWWYHSTADWYHHAPSSPTSGGMTTLTVPQRPTKDNRGTEEDQQAQQPPNEAPNNEGQWWSHSTADWYHHIPPASSPTAYYDGGMMMATTTYESLYYPLVPTDTNSHHTTEYTMTIMDNQDYHQGLHPCYTMGNSHYPMDSNVTIMGTDPHCCTSTQYANQHTGSSNHSGSEGTNHIAAPTSLPCYATTTRYIPKEYRQPPTRTHEECQPYTYPHLPGTRGGLRMATGHPYAHQQQWYNNHGNLETNDHTNSPEYPYYYDTTTPQQRLHQPPSTMTATTILPTEVRRIILLKVQIIMVIINPRSKVVACHS